MTPARAAAGLRVIICYDDDPAGASDALLALVARPSGDPPLDKEKAERGEPTAEEGR